MAEASAFYSGSVEDAIKKVKDQKTCLLVFVYGDDEVSKKYEGYFSSSGKLAQATSRFVCMRLAAQSDTAMQFSAFYPVVSLPTIYLVNADGVSLEALIGDRTEEDLAARIAAAAAAAAAAATGETPSRASAAAPSAGADWDTRVQRMEQKMEERQAEKQREAAEREKRLEQERRSVGKNLGQLRQQQQAEQERAWAEEVRQERQARLREKQQKDQQQQQQQSPTAESPHKLQQQQQQQQQSSSSASPDVDSSSRSLGDLRAAQSAAYHQERRAAEVARSAADAEAEAAKRAAALIAEAERRRVARMQLRCPDGRIFVRELPSSATLRDLRRSIDEELKSPSSSRYRLATVYPRRVFVDSELETSLADLDLAPSASLLLLPPADAGGGSAGGSAAGAGFSSAVALVSAPFVYLARLLALLLGFLAAVFGLGGGGTAAAETASASSHASTSAAAAEAAAASRRRGAAGSGGGGVGATVHRSGNTARLRNIPGANGSEDEDATWNGNSTQQM